MALAIPLSLPENCTQFSTKLAQEIHRVASLFKISNGKIFSPKNIVQGFFTFNMPFGGSDSRQGNYEVNAKTCITSLSFSFGCYAKFARLAIALFLFFMMIYG